ncbi:ABC transporter ATP-binding protein [Halalkalibacter lacteus]|uniref:ABC transporter ATP-binding protein n=1 Tax=Halalkalibacter lacteus TaxID=3090663 RepID=UPI002FC8C435
MSEAIKIDNVYVSFQTREGRVKAVDGVSLNVTKNKIIGIIGETGSGKSILGLSILGLLPQNANVSGNIYYKDKDLLEFSERQFRRIRGREIGLIPQNPTTSLNPVLKIGSQIKDSVYLHHKYQRNEQHSYIINLLSKLKLPQPKEIVNRCPFQISGGMKQRVLAAIGLSGKPHFIIADEPTKGLDAVLRGEVVSLFRNIVSDTGVGLLLITHDLKVAIF